MAGWSGLFNRVHGEDHSLLIPRGHIAARRIANSVVRRMGGILSSERVFTDLVEDVKQVSHTPDPGNPAVHGGAVTVGTNSLTPVASADFINYVEKENKPTYPADASGNGGGGKLGISL